MFRISLLIEWKSSGSSAVIYDVRALSDGKLDFELSVMVYKPVYLDVVSFRGKNKVFLSMDLLDNFSSFSDYYKYQSIPPFRWLSRSKP